MLIKGAEQSLVKALKAQQQKSCMKDAAEEPLLVPLRIMSEKVILNYGFFLGPFDYVGV